MKKIALAASILLPVSLPALAADLPNTKGPAPFVPPPPPAFSWTGFYVGANAGWIGSDNSMFNQATPIPDAVLGVTPGVSEGLAALSTGGLSGGQRSGFIGGGQIGFNFQINERLVAGLETDFQGIAGARSTSLLTTPPGGTVVVGVPVTSTLTGTTNTRWLGTARGRLGFLATPAILLYGTAGLAYANVSANTTLAQSGTNGFIGAGTGGFSQTRAGWAAGGGVEWMFLQHWTAKLEFLHYDLGRSSYSWAAMGTPASAFFSGTVYQTETTSVRFRGDIVRAGLNYNFELFAPPAPVVAKY
ncbi:MAG TPA: outer membrane beta-barrel protein [Methylovirgula sp.]|nr:outer membrane beta-barrel protein [Methylovirgula sp.]